MGFKLTRVSIWLNGETRARTMEVCMVAMWRMKVTTQILSICGSSLRSDLFLVFITNAWICVW